MSLPIRTQTSVVTVSASIMPRMTEEELHEAVARLAYEKESKHGMGALSVSIYEQLDPEQYWESV